jgi:hypothetical protein
MTISELVSAGLSTDQLEAELRQLFATDPKLKAKLDKAVESVEPEKKEVMRSLLVDSHICDLILISHAREAGF